jgi:hypothetical protein
VLITPQNSREHTPLRRSDAIRAPLCAKAIPSTAFNLEGLRPMAIEANLRACFYD